MLFIRVPLAPPSHISRLHYRIDTLGIIESVSALFQGHPHLIEGFNMFLPPGFRVELSIASRNANTITITTPFGALTQPVNPFSAPICPPRDPTSYHIPSPFSQSLLGLSLYGLENRAVEETGEGFIRAIEYLKKIKARYSDTPERNMQFLDMLWTYQKERRQLHDVSGSSTFA